MAIKRWQEASPQRKHGVPEKRRISYTFPPPLQSKHFETLKTERAFPVWCGRNGGITLEKVLLHNAEPRDGNSMAECSYLVQPDDMWVAKHLHDLNFSKYLLQVLFIQLSLINDLDGNLAEGKQKRSY